MSLEEATFTKDQVTEILAEAEGIGNQLSEPIGDRITYAQLIESAREAGIDETHVERVAYRYANIGDNEEIKLNHQEEDAILGRTLSNSFITYPFIAVTEAVAVSHFLNLSDRASCAIGILGGAMFTLGAGMKFYQYSINRLKRKKRERLNL